MAGSDQVCVILIESFIDHTARFFSVASCECQDNMDIYNISAFTIQDKEFREELIKRTFLVHTSSSYYKSHALNAVLLIL